MNAQVDSEKLQQFTRNVSRSVMGGLNCALTLVGDQLGLYRTLNELGPASSQQLADAARLSERWVREWLYQQSCIGQIEYDEEQDTFHLTPEAALVLASNGLVGGGCKRTKPPSPLVCCAIRCALSASDSKIGWA